MENKIKKKKKRRKIMKKEENKHKSAERVVDGNASN